MKKDLTKKRICQLMVLGMVVMGSLLLSPLANAQTISILSEPTGPLYVGDTVEVNYSANSFSTGTIFYLEYDQDTILDSNSATTGTLTGVIPEGYPLDPNLVPFEVYGALGPVDGQVETTPYWGELSLAGTNNSYDYYEENYYPFFNRPGIRRMQLPGLNLTGDSAVLSFEYKYNAWPDSLELAVDYSTNGGSSFTSLDTLEYVNFNTQSADIGIPAAARTSNTILRIRQLYSNILNTSNYPVYFGNLVVSVGEEPTVEGSQALAGSPFITRLPYTNITSITSPGGDPYYGNVYSGDSIFLQANVVGFTADTKFEVVFNKTGNVDDPVYHLSNVVSEEISPNVWEFKALLPRNIQFSTNHFFWLVPYKGSSYQHGTSFSWNFAASGAGNHTISGEQEIDATSGIYFTADNIREVVSDDQIISEEGTMTIELSRRDNVFSPANTEIVVQYSTDEGVTYTTIGSISLNEMNVYTDGPSAFELTIPAGAVSNQTRFRLKQNEINADNLDQFYVYAYTVNLNTNRLSQGLAANYAGNWRIEYVRNPVLDFRPVDVPQGLFYPGTAMNLDYVVSPGKLPANATIRAIITNPDPDILIGETAAASLGTLNGTVPAVYGGTYNVQLQANTSQGTINSSSRSITIEQVDIEILEVTGNPVRKVGDNPYYFAGDEIIVDYNIVGSPANGIQLQIENSDNDFVTIATDNPADEQVTATIPTDIELEDQPRIRLALGDMIYNTSWLELYNRYTGTDFPDNENDSLFTLTQGLINPQDFSINEATFAQAGTREFQTAPFSLTHRGYVQFYFNILDGYYTFEKKVNKVVPILLQYSTDMGTTWVTLESVDPLDYGGTRTYTSPSFFLPFEAISEQTIFRMVQNEENILEFGENAWELLQIRVYSSPTVTLTSNEETLNLQQASISLGTMPKTTFGPGEAVTIPYNIVGNFGVDVGFAVYMMDTNNDVWIVETSDQAGLVQLATNMPVNVPETAGNANEFEFGIVPFQKSAGVTEPIIGYMEDYDDDDTDVIAFEGGVRQTNAWYLYENGRRSVLTKALPQLEGDSAYFDFYMNVYDPVYPSEGIVVEVTHDGGATFTPLDTIIATGSSTLAIANADITAQTHLRWIQYVNFGTNEKEWRISSMMYRSDESNVIMSGYLSLNQPITIEIEYPDLPNQFTVSSQEDVLYSGESFDLELTIPEGMPPLPDATEYNFYLGDLSNNVVIDQNGGEILLGNMTGTGTASLTIPSTVFKGKYRILATLQIDDPNATDPYVYYELVNIFSLDVYNPLLKTINATDEAYRGEEITVNWELQTGSIATADYYFHLVVDDEIIYTQKDAPTNFVQKLPTDMGTGNRDVMILATTDSIYAEGESTLLDVISDDEWIDQGNVGLGSPYLYFWQVSETNRLVSREFNMTNGGKIEFEISYPISGNELLASNKLYLEYSMDGGDTYTMIDEFPNDDYELGDGYEWQTYYFGKGMLNSNTKFRFRRQSGNYGTVYARNFTLTQWSNEAPLDFVEDNISVLTQDVQLGSLPTSICPGGTINLDYTILGSFGEKVTHQLLYYLNGAGYYTFPDYEITGVTEGTGNLEITMPESFSGGDYKFVIRSIDATTDNTFTLYSLPTEDEMYLVPAINFTGTTLSGDQNLCEAGVKTYYIYGAQPYFEYQARNAVTGDPYGDPVSSETGGTLTLFTETIDADIELEILVTAKSGDGLTSCATGVLNDRIEFVMIPERSLYMIDNSSSIWTPADDSYSICENNPQNLRLEAGYYNKNGGYVNSGITSIMWYRDDASNAISSNSQLATFNQTGNYYAEVVADGCSYATDPVNVEVLSVPEKPTVLTSSGELTFCEGASLTLSAEVSYPYYRWYGGSSGNTLMSGSSQSIEVFNDGAYRLVVSDYPLEQGCLSPKSDPVLVNVIEDPNTYIQHAYGGTVLEENSIVSCGEEVVLRVQNEPQTYSWTLNGNVFSTTNDNDEISAAQTGYYNVQTMATQNGVTCVYDSPDSIFVQIANAVDRPDITLSGDQVFCSGGGSATLSAPEGYECYTWYIAGGAGYQGNWLMPGGMVDENTVNIEKTGTYSVSVTDQFGCESDASKTVDITVLPLPSRYSDVRAMDYTLCGPQTAEIQVTGFYYYDRLLIYQLIDKKTGQTVGLPATRTVTDDAEFVLLESGEISETTEFGVMVYDQNATGCEVMLEETAIVNVNVAEIVAIGNQLIATPGAQSYQWYRNGDPILGTRGVSNSITVYDDAEYTVTIVFSFDCIMTASSSTAAKNITGLDNRLASDNVNVYPNPAAEYVTIDFANTYSGDISIEITNVGGQVIYNHEIRKHGQFMNLSIDISDLRQGVYFINFTTDDHCLVKSIVKQ
jgi:hypothetical protein